MIDGRKSVNALGSFVRIGELEAVLDHLLRQGLIQSSDYIAPLQAPVAPGFAAADPTEAPRPATSPDAFLGVRQQALDFVAQRLGPGGEPICDAIKRCDSPAELRKLLRGVEIFVGQHLNAQTAQAFARHFGTLLL